MAIAVSPKIHPQSSLLFLRNNPGGVCSLISGLSLGLTRRTHGLFKKSDAILSWISDRVAGVVKTRICLSRLELNTTQERKSGSGSASDTLTPHSTDEVSSSTHLPGVKCCTCLA